MKNSINIEIKAKLLTIGVALVGLTHCQSEDKPKAPVVSSSNAGATFTQTNCLTSTTSSTTSSVSSSTSSTSTTSTVAVSLALFALDDISSTSTTSTTSLTTTTTSAIVTDPCNNSSYSTTSSSSNTSTIVDDYSDMETPPKKKECNDAGQMYSRKSPGSCIEGSRKETTWCTRSQIKDKFQQMVNAGNAVENEMKKYLDGSNKYEIDECGILNNKPIITMKWFDTAAEQMHQITTKP